MILSASARSILKDRATSSINVSGAILLFSGFGSFFPSLFKKKRKIAMIIPPRRIGKMASQKKPTDISDFPRVYLPSSVFFARGAPRAKARGSSTCFAGRNPPKHTPLRSYELRRRVSPALPNPHSAIKRTSGPGWSRPQGLPPFLTPPLASRRLREFRRSVRPRPFFPSPYR